MNTQLRDSNKLNVNTTNTKTTRELRSYKYVEISTDNITETHKFQTCLVNSIHQRKLYQHPGLRGVLVLRRLYILCAKGTVA